MPNVQVSYHWVTNKPRILWCTTMSIYFAHRSVHWLRSLVWLCSSWFLSGNRLRGWCVPQKAHFMGVAELSEGKLNCTNRFQAPTCIVSANILLARENLWPSLKKRDRVILSCVCVCVWGNCMVSWQRVPWKYTRKGEELLGPVVQSMTTLDTSCDDVKWMSMN